MRLLNTKCLCALLLACALAGCDDQPDTPTNPTPPSTVTDTFSGTVTQNGAGTHNFTVSTGGAVTATLKAIGTENTLVVGFSLGNWNSTASSCSIVLANDAATGGAVLTGTMTASGSLCVRIYDVGNITAGSPATYSVEVVHP
ncbi:MAG: hypothetical protein ACRD15_15900 [Vicinamibacterales bacterium]